MSTLLSTHAEERLTHLAQQFAQWRQSRTTPRGHDPQTPGLRWPRLLALYQTPLVGPVSLVAHRRHIQRHAVGAGTEHFAVDRQSRPGPVGPALAARSLRG